MLPSLDDSVNEFCLLCYVLEKGDCNLFWLVLIKVGRTEWIWSERTWPGSGPTLCFVTPFLYSHSPIDNMFPEKQNLFQESIDRIEKSIVQTLSKTVWEVCFCFIWKHCLYIDFSMQYSKLSDSMLILVQVEWESIAVTMYTIYFKILLILCLLRKCHLCLGRSQRHTWIFLLFSLLKAINEGAAFRFYFF